MATPERSDRFEELAQAPGAPEVHAMTADSRASGRRQAPRPRRRPARTPRRTILIRRLRLAVVLGALAAVAVGLALTAKVGPELRLPLADQALIRAQAQQKHLDPALIAAVIYAETKFVARESSAGAEGLMQLLPSTAEDLAHRTGGIDFKVTDLGDPEVNIAYGSYYLRYLLNHYGGQELPAIAAYNAGMTRVDEWVARAKSGGRTLSAVEIPYPQTREYVRKVISAQSEYRRIYPRQLGIG
ncbi:MAG: lytic transglycosylase domain-containing protein [Solirubrobacteraceae bacterium]